MEVLGIVLLPTARLVRIAEPARMAVVLVHIRKDIVVVQQGDRYLISPNLVVRVVFGELGIEGVIVVHVIMSTLVIGNILQYVAAFSKIILIPFNSTIEISFSLILLSKR